MKKILFLAAFACMSLFGKAQKIRVTIDFDSIADNKVFIDTFKIKKSLDRFVVVTTKINGQVYGDETAGNFNVTYEWRIDSSAGFTAEKLRLRAEKEKEIRQQEARLLRLYEKNKGIDPQLKDKNKQGAQQGFIGDVPKSYNYGVGFKPIEVQTKKRKWWQRKK